VREREEREREEKKERERHRPRRSKDNANSKCLNACGKTFDARSDIAERGHTTRRRAVHMK
jgi:hypothetical protein